MMKRGKRLNFIFIVLALVGMFNARSIYATGISLGTGWKLNLTDYNTSYAGDVINSGTLSLSIGSISLSGNWTNTGTFDGGADGEVSFTGTNASTITGENTFVNFTCAQAGKTLNFEAGNTQTITSTLTLTGTSGRLLKLRSTNSGIQWKIDPQSRRVISFVDVQDSNNINTTVINPQNSSDSGNNRNWFDSIATTPTPSPVATTTSTPVTVPTPTPTNSSEVVKANFEAVPRLGIVPLEVQFTDKSIGNINVWLWGFGDGVSSDDQNPTNIYTLPGLYDVILTVSGPDDQDIKEERRLIDVRPVDDLVADFSVSASIGLVPFTVEFIDESKNGANAWLWNFGDSGQSSEQNPTHIYDNAGIFTVSLTVSNSTDSDTITKQNIINVEAVNVVADFKASPIVGFPPLKVEFSDLSEPEDDLVSWLWEFGDGANSTEKNPSNEYDVEGFYSVKLTISSLSGESEVKVKTNLVIVKAIGTPLAEFSASPTVIKAPTTVKFSDLSEPANDLSSWIWDFGDGSTSIEQTPEHEYKSEGIYTVRLTVSNATGADSEVKTNLIGVQGSNSPVAEFNASPSIGRTPLKVTFIDNSAGDDINSWLWEFGDGGQATEQNTTHVYSAAGIYNVKLTVSGSSGSDIENKNNLINVVDSNEPVADFSANAVIIEKSPFDVQFIDNSVGEINLWEWDFGDGETNSGQDQNPVHTYSNRGKYTVKLKVVTGNSTDTAEKVEFITVIKDASDEPETTPTPDEIEQVLAELVAVPDTIQRSSDTSIVTVLARDQNGSVMKDVIISAQASGRKANVNPSSALTDEEGKAEFEVQFRTFRKISSVMFTSDGVATTVKQN